MQYNIFKLVCFYTISMLAGSLGIHLKCTCSYWTRGTFALQVVPKQKSCSELIYCKSKIYVVEWLQDYGQATNTVKLE